MQACRDATMAQAMWELRHRDLLTRVLSELHAIGIQPVLIKGTALAYGLYANGALRSRGDTDLMIPPNTQSQVDGMLRSLNFEREMGMRGEFVSYQGSYTRSSAGEGRHTLDVHWRINNSELLSRLFTHAELLQQTDPLPQLSPHALAAGPVHALLIACMHRATHKENPYYVDGVAYYGGDRLIWLYDIHLLVEKLSQVQVDDFLKQAKAKGLRAVCLDGIRRAQVCFHTRIPENILASLSAPGPREAPSYYLDGGGWRQRWMDFVALGSLRNRAVFLKECAFPSGDYMRSKYAPDWQGALAWLYLQRGFNGLSKRLWRRH